MAHLHCWCPRSLPHPWHMQQTPIGAHLFGGVPLVRHCQCLHTQNNTIEKHCEMSRGKTTNCGFGVDKNESFKHCKALREMPFKVEASRKQDGFLGGVCPLLPLSLASILAHSLLKIEGNIWYEGGLSYLALFNLFRR